MAPKWFKNINVLEYNNQMSLSQLIEEILDPQDPWIQAYARRTNNALAEYQKKFASPICMDLYPVDGGMELKVDLPGMNKEDVNLEVHQNVITLSGERKREIDEEDVKYHYSERAFGKFTRKLRLPYNADPSTVSAKFDNGVLTVSIPQPESTRAGQIMID